jgi:ribosomal protein S18
VSDPYEKEIPMCVLCPRKYETPIRPDWRNPKLLAQFVSLHTGLVYKKNVTGLCQFMQDEVEREVKIAQNIGYLATKMKEPHYIKDPKLFEPSRPTRKNHY